MNETSDLAKWMVGLKWVDIPREVIDYSKILVPRYPGLHVRRIDSGQ